MMGPTHVAAGVFAGAISAPVVGASPAAQTVWIVLVAGGALLPDLDTRTSTIARGWGPVTQLPAGGVAALSGGHRWATHDLILGPLVIYVMASVAVAAQAGRGVVVAVSIGLILAAVGSIGLGRIGAVGNLALSTAGGVWASAQEPSAAAGSLPAALALGALVHIVCDGFTSGGVPVPLMWLLRRRRVAVPVVRTGGVLEVAIVAPLLTIGSVWMTLRHTAIGALV